MNWDQSAFLDEVKTEFEDKLNDIEIPDSCYDIEEGCWDEDKVRTIDGLDLGDLFSEAVTSRVLNDTHFTNDCWDICKDIIGCDDFLSHAYFHPNPINIYQMAGAALYQFASVKLDFRSIFSDWLGELDPPEAEAHKGVDRFCKDEHKPYRTP